MGGEAMSKELGPVGHGAVYPGKGLPTSEPRLSGASNAEVREYDAIGILGKLVVRLAGDECIRRAKELMRCETCRYWIDAIPGYQDPPFPPECKHVKLSLAPEIVHHPPCDFGCIHWEPKP